MNIDSYVIMNHFVLSLVFVFLLFPMGCDVFAELSVNLDKEIVFSTNDPVTIRAKLDYVSKDTFVVIQITDPGGFLFLNRYVPTDNNGEFNIDFAGSDNFPLSGGIYDIKVTGISNNDDTIIDTSSVIINVKQRSVMPADSTTQNNGGCLIATATFGSELSTQVQTLRETRDNVVLQTESGRMFMTIFNQVYYLFSPTISDIERENNLVKEVVKFSITPLLYTLSFLHVDYPISELELIFYGIVIIGLNLMIYCVIPYLSFLKLKDFLIPRITTKNKHIS